jgi:hypothetical protein
LMLVKITNVYFYLHTEQKRGVTRLCNTGMILG